MEKYRGKPSIHTNKDKIGSDVKVEYNKITVEEVFDIEGNKVSNFFLTEATADQLKKQGAVETLKTDVIVCEPYRHTNQATGKSYFWLRNPTKPAPKQERLNK